MTNSDPQDQRLRDEVERLRRRLALLEAGEAGRVNLGQPGPLEDSMESIVEAIPTGIYIYQGDQVVFANSAAFVLVGLDPSKDNRSQLLTHVHPDYRDLVRERAIARSQGKGAEDAYEIKIVRESGEIAWVLVKGVLITYRGEPATLGVAIDITDRKKAEESLKTSQIRLRAIVENTSDFILLSDRTGSPVYFNSAYARIMKALLNIDMKPGLKPHTLLPDKAAQKVWEEYHERVLSGERFQIEYSIEEPDGRPHHLEVSYYPVIEDGEINGFCEFTHEVTARKNAEEKLSLAVEDRALQLRRVAGGLAHEIYNDLFPVTSSIQKLRERLSDSEDEGRERNLELLDLMERALQRALDLTESVNLFSKLERLRTDRRVNLADVIADVLKHNESRLKEMGVNTNIEVPETLSVNCPLPYIYHLFNNLLINALDAMLESSEKNLTITASHQQGRVEVSFADSGSGIASEHLNHVFEPFFSTKPGHGTGLGLAIVKRIVDLSGGSVSLETAPNKGTTFIVKLKGSDSQDL